MPKHLKSCPLSAFKVCNWIPELLEAVQRLTLPSLAQVDTEECPLVATVFCLNMSYTSNAKLLPCFKSESTISQPVPVWSVCVTQPFVLMTRLLQISTHITSRFIKFPGGFCVAVRVAQFRAPERAGPAPIVRSRLCART